MIKLNYRYDLLCIEGIARALRVFLGKDKPPVYKLYVPPGGEKDLIEVSIAPEVRASRNHKLPHTLTLGVDKTSSTVIRLRCPAGRHLYSPIIPVFHRFAGQATPKLMPASPTCRDWNT